MYTYLIYSIPDVTTDQINALKNGPDSKGTPLEYLLQDQLQLFPMDVGNLQMGSMLPLQVLHVCTTCNSVRVQQNNVQCRTEPTNIN